MKVKPMGMLLMMLSGWINRHQQDVIVHLKGEDRILREKLDKGALGIRVPLVQVSANAVVSKTLSCYN